MRTLHRWWVAGVTVAATAYLAAAVPATGGTRTSPRSTVNAWLTELQRSSSLDFALTSSSFHMDETGYFDPLSGLFAIDRAGVTSALVDSGVAYSMIPQSLSSAFAHKIWVDMSGSPESVNVLDSIFGPTGLATLVGVLDTGKVSPIPRTYGFRMSVRTSKLLPYLGSSQFIVPFAFPGSKDVSYSIWATKYGLPTKIILSSTKGLISLRLSNYGHASRPAFVPPDSTNTITYAQQMAALTQG